MINHPRLLSIASFFALWLFAHLGAFLRGRNKPPSSDTRESLGIVVSATLTLLGLIIGFTFSMAASRYDQRKLYEEQEANAIGTEYVRADLLPPPQAIIAKSLLIQYLNARIVFYTVDYGAQLTADNSHASQLQAQLWASIKPQAQAAPNPVTALVVSGMNDVLNSQGYTQFSWWNRIPTSAWGLLFVIALSSNLLIGYATTRSRDGNLLLIVLPVLISISFFLISDIDSPRGGLIRVQPQNLKALSQSLGPS